MAIGRKPLTGTATGLDKVKVQLDQHGYVIGQNGTETTSVDNIFAIGDILKVIL